ncbi:MAG: sulfotransferase [Verrucomicrobiota bacterium]
MSIYATPNLIVIGAGKAGTTSLHNYLSAHPQIFGSKNKELMYFSRFMDRGAEWYKSNFPKQELVKFYFESTPQYSFRDEFPDVPMNIFNFNSHIKIIYIVREPISRIISHFNHWAQIKNGAYRSLGYSLGKSEHRKYFVDRTRYYYQLEAYLKYFKSNQIKVVFLEDLNRNFASSLNEVFHFLQVDQLAQRISQVHHNVATDRGAKQRLWTKNDLCPSRLSELYGTLSEDVQRLLAHCGKPKNFWGEAYT